MKKRIYSIIIVVFLLIIGGCEDFLDERPVAQETTDSFLGDPSTTEANFEQMLHAAYSVYTISEATWQNNRHYFENMISDWMADDCQKGGNGAGDLPEMLDMKSWTALPMATTTSHYETPWLVGYLGANRANTILVLLEQYKDNLSSASYTRIKGECYFIRGYFYFLLAKCFGSVPYFPEPVTTEQYYDQQKVAPEELYALIEADLNEAISLVPEASNWGAIFPGGRGTKGAARAIQARVITMEIGFGFNGKTWQDVYDQTKAIINSNEYSLLPNYATIFENEGENSSESVFEIPCADLGSTAYGAPGGNMEQRMTTLRPDPALTYGPNTPTLGWGFSTPTQNLFDEFEAGDYRRECTITANNDVFMGDTVPTAVSTFCPTGYWFRKYAGPDPRINTSGDKNIRNVRYAEVLLTHAEAAYHIGEEAEALETVNIVRARAQTSTGPKGSVPGEIDTYPTEVSTLGPITATGGQALLDAIKHERRVELGIEGLRAWDLIRWGEFEDAIRTSIIPEDYFLNTLDPEQVVTNYRSHLMNAEGIHTGTNEDVVPCLPIPSDEVEDYRIEQNPGY
jgi:hypothetical protein